MATGATALEVVLAHLRSGPSIAAVLVSLMCSSTAFAIEGYIVDINAGEVVVDVGTAEGVPPGATLLVYRKLVVQHPVTGKKITDRFPIGELQLEQVGERLAVTRNLSKLRRQPSVGDYVVYLPLPPRGASAGDLILPATAPAPTEAITDDRRALDATFRATLGRSLYDRIELWEAWLGKYPQSGFAPEIGNELHWLRLTYESEPTAPTTLTEPPVERADVRLHAAAAVLEGSTLQVDVVTDRPELVDSIRLHSRPVGHPTFETTELRHEGDMNWRGILPPSLTAAPGKVEFFVDTVRTDGQLEKSDTLRATKVEPNPDDPKKKSGRSRANLVYEFVDFRVRAGADEFHRFEADYRYAIGTVLNGFTVGAGVFRGSGASLDELAAGEETRTLNLSYAYAEADFEFLRYLGLSGRLLVGNRQQLGVQGSILRDAFGGNLEFRFGTEEGTRLLLGGAVTKAVGAEAWINLFVESIDRVPMSGEVVVTNLPVGENLGVSLNYGAGWRFTDWLTVMARVGWNARTIFDYGFSAGLNTRLQW